MNRVPVVFIDEVSQDMELFFCRSNVKQLMCTCNNRRYRVTIDPSAQMNVIHLYAKGTDVYTVNDATDIQAILKSKFIHDIMKHCIYKDSCHTPCTRSMQPSRLRH